MFHRVICEYYWREHNGCLSVCQLAFWINKTKRVNNTICTMRLQIFNLKFLFWWGRASKLSAKGKGFAWKFQFFLNPILFARKMFFFSNQNNLNRFSDKGAESHNLKSSLHFGYETFSFQPWKLKRSDDLRTMNWRWCISLHRINDRRITCAIWNGWSLKLFCVQLNTEQQFK